MYCKHCGERIEKSSKFCTYCGKEISSAPPSKYLELHEKASVANTIESRELAGLWVRFGAYMIDLLGLFAVALLMGIGVYILFEEKRADQLLETIPDAVFGYICYVLYSTASLAFWSTTVGKHLFGLTVTTEENEKLDFSTALKRSLLQPFSTLLFGVGYWGMDKKERKQSWHDQSAKTLVWQEKKNLTLAYIVAVLGILAWAFLSAVEYM